jgi:hypothetical protein
MFRYTKSSWPSDGSEGEKPDAQRGFSLDSVCSSKQLQETGRKGGLTRKPTTCRATVILAGIADCTLLGAKRLRNKKQAAPMKP